ncbi:V-set and immunoglobulin domain-containing protein 10 isoform X2 [Choloepus didactylus]|uniref:V-set and immunoglobulin domain-containing protein 10 isoform X2 n=1 Tax=Choloepus didactylus TaxID=27675 RepID=UPI00189F0854|nr:V-set and immunoglobulin domain-containing protein 10 isoform X2 [Choloepus didactylus]
MGGGRGAPRLLFSSSGSGRTRPPTPGPGAREAATRGSPAPALGLTPSILPGCCGQWGQLGRSDDLGGALGTPGPRAPGDARPAPPEPAFPAGVSAGVGGEMAAGVWAPEPRVLVCLAALLARWVVADLEAVIIGEVHENITLHCGNLSGPEGLVTWYRNDAEPFFLLSSNSSLLPTEPRFSLDSAGSLHIEGLRLQDEGNYTCQEGPNGTQRFRVWLQVASGPFQVEVNISGAGSLPNGTFYVSRGSQVNFTCSSAAWPPPRVEWWFQAPDSRTELFGDSRRVSSFTLLPMSPSLQGNYTCSATNTLSRRRREVTAELLVYSPPPSAPQCSAEIASGLLMVQLTCRWVGGYPDPNFLWTEEPGGVVVGKSSLGVEMLNQSQLSDGKTFKCVGSHIVGPESGASCTVQIRTPSLLSEPMKTCFVGGNVTLTCQVSGAYPPAKILWLRNLTLPEVVIQPDGHYLITQHGQTSTLTIHNCSQDLDEGYYVCRAENVVGPREVDIWLSVKEPVNIGGIVGTIVSLLLLGLAIILGLMLYYSPVFCWKGNTFRRQDMGDVMVLVDSEEEEEEEDAAAEEEEDEEEENEREELPKETHRHGHIHRVTALVNGNIEQMGNGLPALQDDNSELQSDIIIQEEDRPV